MFTVEDRETLRAELLARAQSDPHLVAAAITGSGAGGTVDRWSDIDLAFSVQNTLPVANVLAEWTAHMYSAHQAVHHMDVHAGDWIYRVFLLANTLQVDLAFAPESEFRALAPTFRLIFGQAQPPRHMPQPDPAGLISFSWLYALHVRSAIARNKLWQAEAMLHGLRDQAMSLACLRHGLPAIHAKGLDQLPPEDLARFSTTLVPALTLSDLERAFHAALRCLMHEIELADLALAQRLQYPLKAMGETTFQPPSSPSNPPEQT